MKRIIVFSLILAALVAGPEASAEQPNYPATFSLPGLDGKTHELSEWRGKVVLINFWASWCSPCQTEIRDLTAFQAQYADKGLQIIGIGMDDEQKLRNVQRSLEINYPVLLANKPGNNLMSRYGNKSGVVPYSVLLARDGNVVSVYTGLINKEMFDEKVLPLLH